MKNIFKKLVAVFCIISIFASSVPSVFAAKENDNHLLYGRKQLEKAQNADSLTEAYDKIVEGIENREATVILEEYSLTRDDLDLIVTLYRNDPHAHFWLDNSYSFQCYTDGTVYSFKPKYNSLGDVSDEEFEKEVNDFNKEINAIIRKAGIKEKMSQYEIELRLHNILVNELDYISTENCHNAYGAIVEKQAVCQGYTLAYNYLLRLCGIEAHYVSGYSRDIPHAWSLISIDGSYYYTDITWDDPIGTNENCHEIFHSYFNLTEEQMKKDHSFSNIPYQLPECNSAVDSYYTHNPERIMTESITPELFASFFHHGSASVFVPEENKESFGKWCSANMGKIASLAGYDMSKPFSYVYVYSGDEYHFIINGTLIEPEFTVLLGDVNGDGSVNSIDSNLLKRIIAGSMTPSEINILGADIDKDGKLTSIDSNLLKRLIAGS